MINPINIPLIAVADLDQIHRTEKLRKFSQIPCVQTGPIEYRQWGEAPTKKCSQGSVCVEKIPSNLVCFLPYTNHGHTWAKALWTPGDPHRYPYPIRDYIHHDILKRAGFERASDSLLESLNTFLNGF